VGWEQHQRSNIRGKVERVAKEQAHPIVLQNDREEKQLRDVEREVQREEGVGMHVERVGPFYG
jgi:hypothetical protein